MNNTRIEYLKSLFAEAIELNNEQRSAFLSSLHTSEPELAAELSSLLTSHESTGDFFEPLSLAFQNTDEHIGEHIGPYRIVREVAQGGMGEVYEAVRDDGVFKKRVAVKLVRYGLTRGELLRRFELERQTLAKLEHPNIARLLDGGTSSDNVPYLVMEFVEGRRIDEYCDTCRLSIRERLELFRTVCAAVQYAHQNLIVHRDIKPGNILVTSDGVPKLLDFGVAKLLSAEQSTDAELTRTGSAIFTPEYASPEQVKGENVTTLSDVYSLGVLLYKLLTGQKPYEFKSSIPFEISKTIIDTEPTKPSAKEIVIHARGESAETIRRTLNGDLDAIILTALRKEPKLRYQSVRELSEDIRRHLERLPVSARKGAAIYRVSRFVQRHRAGAIAFVIVNLAIIAGITGIVWQGEQAKRERDRAKLEAAKAEEINEFLQKMLSSVDPNKKGRDVKVAEVLDASKKRIEKELNSQPEVAAALHFTVGTTYQGLGLYDEAEPHLRKALALRQELFSPAHPEIAASLRQLGNLLYEMGRYEESEERLRQSVAMYRNLATLDSIGLAESLDGLGIVLNNRGKNDEAEASYREALAIFRVALKKNDERMASVLNNLGVLSGTRGDFAEAEPLHREALGIMRSIYGEKHPRVAWTLYNLGGVVDAQGKYEQSAPLFQQALAIWRELQGEEHSTVIMTLATLASTHSLMKEYYTAQRFAAEAVTKAEKVLPKDHPLTAYAHAMLGSALTDGGKSHLGETHLRTALQIRKKALPANHYLIANTESLLGSCLAVQGRFDEAEPLLLGSYEKLKTKFGDRHEKTIAARERIAKLYEAMKKPEAALKFRD